MSEPVAASTAPIELSFAIPCLNEAGTIARCVEAALRFLEKHGIAGEVVVADNASTDGSGDLARAAGARVVLAPVRGYGSAVLAAVGAARGTFVVLGDADLQHDFEACLPFVERLRAGTADLVVGNRYASGAAGGRATTLLNRIGAGFLSGLGRLLFRAPVTDFHCGLRAFRRDRFLELDLRTGGFEFTTEHIVRSALRRQKIAEVPVAVRAAGRASHLRPFHDGWRTARFLLLLAPQLTLIGPGLALMALGGLLAALVARGRAVVAGIELDVHTLIMGCMLFLVGATAAQIGFAVRIYTMEHELGPPPAGLRPFFRLFTLERGLLLGAVILLAGCALVGELTWRAITVRLRPEEVFATLRPMVLGSTLVALGAETVLMSFFYSMLAVRGRHEGARASEPPAPPRT